jgi:MFS family permease
MKFTRTVWLLSFISLFTDMASEMLYPVIPLYLTQIGLTVTSIGFLEGLAEITAGISKGYFGNLSDHLGKRVVFIKAGYALSAISKPLMAVFQFVGWIFFARTTDRLGKGLRTAARDAMLAAECGPADKARVFGFHRALDTVGAIIGPWIVLLILRNHFTSLRNVFYLAFIPGVISIALIFLLKEKPAAPSQQKKPGFFSFFGYWKKSPVVYKRLLTGTVLFFLFNSSDVFLLLRSRELLGGDEAAMYTTIRAYILYNIVYAVFAYPAGMLADRFNTKSIYLTGLLLFAVVYGGMAFAQTATHIYIIFAVYGIYAAATEGILKAWMSHIIPETSRATAFGLAASCQNLAAMFASFFAGIIWAQWGAATVFMLAAGVAVFVVGYFLVLVPGRNDMVHPG